MLRAFKTILDIELFFFANFALKKITEMKRLLFSLFLGLCIASFANAQKEYRQIRASIKSKSNLDNTMKNIQEYEKNDEFKNDPELYFLGADVQQKINDGENEKIYLKQSYDTVKFFTSTYNIFDYLLRCDEKEQIPDDKGKLKFKYRNKSRIILNRYYPNLRSGGQFFLNKKKYDSAERFFFMYINAAKSGIFQNDNLLETDSKMPRVAYWALISSYMLNHYDSVLINKDLALKDTAYKTITLEYIARSYQNLKDSDNYIATLKQGVKEYPSYPFFFTHLIDIYNNKQQYDQALNLTNAMLKIDSTSVLFNYAKSLVYLNTLKYDSCIELSLDVLKEDSTYADAYYNVGICYCNKAVDMEKKQKGIDLKSFAERKVKIQGFYERARPFMERYRVLEPDKIARWAPVLYRIYLHLNLGKQFDEIDKLLKKGIPQTG